jgi:hypothetical protein
MAHTQSWDQSDPANADKAGLGATEIRDVKRDVDERMSIAHKWGDSTTYDGEHLLDTVYAADTASTAFTVDMANGWTQNVTLKHNVTFTFSLTVPGSASGRLLTLILTQDATGGRTVTWPSSVKWPQDGAPTLDTTLSTVSILQFITLNGGSRWYGSFIGTRYTA